VSISVATPKLNATLLGDIVWRRNSGDLDADMRFRLLFMTYNGWVMLAVAVGAFVGYMLFSESSATKTAACH
jgi:hypothetical protein